LSTEDNTNQHKTIQERIEAASKINCVFPIYCDSLNQNNFENVYSGWPERAFIIRHSQIKFISYHKVDGYDDWHLEAEEKIEELLGQE
jgi:hypothetical protein